MAEVKAMFPIGKTQWRKWRTEQRIAFNEACQSGMSLADATKYVNELELVEVNIAPGLETGLMGALEETLDGLRKLDTPPVPTRKPRARVAKKDK
jgi:hypothetical protein